jgi:hypothetical protein
VLGVGQAVGCIELAGFNIQTDAGAGDQVAIDSVPGRLKLRIGTAKPLAVPQVHASLVPDLDVGVQVLEQALRALNDLILGLQDRSSSK